MQELEQILRDHAKRYPKMQPTDAVKLIYQSEFGGGHLIQDEAACLQYLRREYAAVEKNPSAPRREYIGNGITRVNLAPLEESELEDLGRAFIQSAAVHKGSLERFLAKLSVLKNLARQGVFSFGVEELEAYLSEYEKQGYPAVSHSAVYRQHYSPAYRIIKE